MAADSSLFRRLTDDIRAAMRAREAARLACLRQVKAKLQEAEVKLGPWPGGEPDDGQVRAVIAAYRKSLAKAAGELAAAGERSQTLRDRYRAEIEMLAAYLPPPLDEATLARDLKRLAGELGIVDARGAGRLVGALVRHHGDAVDPAAARRAIDQMFAAGGG